jgi:antitoxin HicB
MPVSQTLLTLIKPKSKLNYMANLRYNLVYQPEPEGGFTVIVPALPGCITYGKNLKEAKKMAIDAIDGYIISLVKHNEPIPSDNESFIGTIDIKAGLKKKAYA